MNGAGSEPKHRISHVSTVTGHRASAIRYWEKVLGEEIITPARHTGGARRYSDRDVQTFRDFVQLREAGYSLQGAKAEIVRQRALRPEIETVEQAVDVIARATQAIARETNRLDEAREFLASHATNSV